MKMVKMTRKDLNLIIMGMIFGITITVIILTAFLPAEMTTDLIQLLLFCIFFLLACQFVAAFWPVLYDSNYDVLLASRDEEPKDL